ncbi:YbhB/YbcL family Raf kinase inhibitor-like protein [Sphingomonas sp. KR1UV-12]|uniref:YbhB/YbcL family Raf kinase inhibitor-like protein n=1 Tax=Sphingomonas aurea TaxID=3063994 RepID=A0ABT9EL13_9SPHN|nr:YbhB/YbcL family Raf kinase inhibitor-like protein [Sphingomonas sp. KR1UV-12]MDP1027663.1 YbhB/YbcL family Raf kinase inhibitor-like protein [Sphingomonas sp. KR1UV-12]
MLEHIPQWLGQALRGVRAGTDKLAIADPALGGAPGQGFARLDLTSTAFADGGRLPPRFTADGEGVSPPLLWRDPPAGTAWLALLVEDADSPTPQPLVHAVVRGLPATAGQLAEGAIRADGEGSDGGDVGRNSYRREGWLPPDPPTGHGEHRYAFQLFAVDAGAADPGVDPGRSALVAAMAGHVLAAGLLVGTYSRSEDAPVGPVGAAVAG